MGVLFLNMKITSFFICINRMHLVDNRISLRKNMKDLILKENQFTNWSQLLIKIITKKFNDIL
jgi:hypothetical protein